MRSDDQPFGPNHALNDAATSFRRKVHRAVDRGTGCRLTADEVLAANCLEMDGDWWNAPRDVRRVLETREAEHG